MPNSSFPSQPGFFRVYLELVKEKELPLAFSNQSQVIKDFLPGITEEQSSFAYAPGKWTLTEMLQHIIDAERIFSYRALCFARKDSTALPSFDENHYAAASNANNRNWKNLTEEFISVRRSTLFLFNSFSPEMLDSNGKAGINTISVKEIGFLIVGHFAHHKKIIEEWYL